MFFFTIYIMLNIFILITKFKNNITIPEHTITCKNGAPIKGLSLIHIIYIEKATVGTNVEVNCREAAREAALGHLGGPL